MLVLITDGYSTKKMKQKWISMIKTHIHNNVKSIYNNYVNYYSNALWPS